MKKLIKIFIYAPKLFYALEAAWYAMEKHSRQECAREIKTAKEILNKIES